MEGGVSKTVQTYVETTTSGLRGEQPRSCWGELCFRGVPKTMQKPRSLLRKQPRAVGFGRPPSLNGRRPSHLL